MNNALTEYVDEEVKVLHNLEYDKISKIIDHIMHAYNTGGRIYLMGNGGSSANASHWVNDLKKNIMKTDNGFDVVCLSDNIPLLTAYANDVSYEDVFLSQIEGGLKKEDVIIALSVSGNSDNIINAIKYAYKMRCHTIAIVGDFDGRISDFSDTTIKIGTKNYGIAEDIQQTISHMVSQKLACFLSKN